MGNEICKQKLQQQVNIQNIEGTQTTEQQANEQSN